MMENDERCPHCKVMLSFSDPDNNRFVHNTNCPYATEKEIRHQLKEYQCRLEEYRRNIWKSFEKGAYARLQKENRLKKEVQLYKGKYFVVKHENNKLRKLLNK